MRILHTADWHLGDYLHRLDRTADLRLRVRRVAELCEERSVDVLVIAGDLFSDHSAVTYEKMTAELEHIQEVFAAFFARGGTILAITGNHDKDTRSEFIRAGMNLAATRSKGSPLKPGRMYLHNEPAVVALEARGERVQFVLVPYPFTHRYAREGDSFTTPEEQNRTTKERVVEWVQAAQSQPGYDPSLPSVLVAHLNVSGAETHALYKLSERDDVQFDADFVPKHWAYVALGHIHKAQALGAEHVRYPGPLDRLDFGERDDDRGVVLVDLVKGQPAKIEHIPLEATPMLDIAITHPDEVAKLTAHETAIVRVVVRHASSAAEKDAITRQLKKLYPRYADLRWEPPEAEEQKGEAVRTQADYRVTVREHLRKKLVDHADAEAILVLAESFLLEDA